MNPSKWGEISGKSKLIGAHERNESIHNHDELSHVIAPKRCEKDERKSNAVELERKPAKGESEEVARWSSMERWRPGVEWPESDGGALGASSIGDDHHSYREASVLRRVCGSASRLPEKTFYRAFLLDGVDHCKETIKRRK
jgi:hypothetical protein